jgi:hypothetical protein
MAFRAGLRSGRKPDVFRLSREITELVQRIFRPNPAKPPLRSLEVRATPPVKIIHSCKLQSLLDPLIKKRACYPRAH